MIQGLPSSEEEMLAAWMSNQPEELDPKLTAYLVESSVGLCVKHPLVFSVPHHASRNRYANLQLRAKEEALAEATAAGRWQEVLWLYEKPYRAEMLFGLQNRIEDDAEWWSLVSFVWTNAENHREWGPLIEALLLDGRPGREAMMDEDERAALAAMPATIKVYRGYRGPAYGWSWTMEIEVARQFARRFAFRGDRPAIAHGKLDKRLVVAYFAGESEIVANPADVRVYRTSILKDSPQ